MLNSFTNIKPSNYHQEPPIPYTESPFTLPPQTAHAKETKNAPSETMDEAIDNSAKDPGPFQQRYAPAAELEGKIAESMDEKMVVDPAAATPNTKLKNKSQRQTQSGPRSTNATKKQNSNLKAKRRARQATGRWCSLG